MYKIKVFIKASIKKLKKNLQYKETNLFFCLRSLINKNNKNLNIVVKKLNKFLILIKNKTSNERVFNNLLNNIYIHSISFSPSKKLKRLNFRAKGKTDIINKRNSVVTITLYKKDNPLNKFDFYKKNYTIKSS